MALQYPNIVPTGFTDDYQDFIARTKIERSGNARSYIGQVSVPSGTVVGQLIGLFAFSKGFKLSYGSWFQTAALGTSVTAALGYYYEDSTITSVTNGFLTASSNAAAGGLLTPAVVAGSQWQALGNGWIVALIGGATTTTTNNISFNALGTYDYNSIV